MLLSNKGMTKEFAQLFDRDIRRLYKEMESYTSEEIIWQKVESISNPAGNLCLHLVGNLNEYIGRILGQNPYQRDRPYEFSAVNVPQKELLSMVEKTREVVVKTLESLEFHKLNEIYPENVLGYEMTVSYFLIHLEGHLNYHLGQINYHRRIL
jgi:uncharacterized damage-inducible protein DinB